MSRTDQHRPWVVQSRDPAIRRRCIPWHQHVDRDWKLRDCDLWTEEGAGHCYWVPYWNTCGCRNCTGHHECKAERRQSRHRAQRELRNALKERSVE